MSFLLSLLVDSLSASSNKSMSSLSSSFVFDSSSRLNKSISSSDFSFVSDSLSKSNKSISSSSFDAVSCLVDSWFSVVSSILNKSINSSSFSSLSVSSGIGFFLGLPLPLFGFCVSSFTWFRSSKFNNSSREGKRYI